MEYRAFSMLDDVLRLRELALVRDKVALVKQFGFC
jgi:hypothetical protein